MNIVLYTISKNSDCEAIFMLCPICPIVAKFFRLRTPRTKLTKDNDKYVNMSIKDKDKYVGSILL